MNMTRCALGVGVCVVVCLAVLPCCRVAVRCHVLPYVGGYSSVVRGRVFKCTEAKCTASKPSALVVLRTLEKFCIVS